MSNRSFRQQVGRFVVEGPQAVREAVIHRPDVVEEVFVVPNPAGPLSLRRPDLVKGSKGAELAALAAAAGLRVTEVAEQVLLAITETVHPQGIAAVCRFVDVPLAEALAGARLVAVLHDVRDPGNAGAIIRTADAAGADAVVFTGESVDPYNGKCVRSTAGSLFHIRLAIEPSIDEVLVACRGAGLRLLAATGRASRTLPDAEVARWTAEPLAWLFGNEAHGLPDGVVARADAAVAIPIYGAAESLNLAGAAAVTLYATAFSRRHP